MRYVAFGFVMLLPLCAMAQVSGSISGSVADQSGSAVVGAAVKLIPKPRARFAPKPPMPRVTSLSPPYRPVHIP